MSKQHALTLLFTSLAYFSLSEFGLFYSIIPVWLMLSSPNACLIIASVSVHFFQYLHKM
jgi:hypothetical protein